MFVPSFALRAVLRHCAQVQQGVNKVLDASHGGHRDQLMSAVSAFNALPRRPTGVAPETLWRALRPLESRWRNRTLKAVCGDAAPAVSDQILDEHAAIGVDVYQKATARFAEDVQQLQKLFCSATQRAQMALRVKKNQKTMHSAPLVTGDRVLCRSTQYRSSAGFGKFERSGSGLREFTVLSLSGGTALLQEDCTGRQITRHESLLKILPNAVKPGQSGSYEENLPSPRAKERAKGLETVGPFWLLCAEPDGACLFRSLAMGMMVLAGVHPVHVLDSDVAAAELRARVVRQSRLWLQSLCAEDLAAAEAIALAELRDEPTWDFNIAFTWARFLDFLALPRSYTTTWALQQFVLMEHINVRVYQKQDGNIQAVWEEKAQGEPHGALFLLRTKNHFDLLVLSGSKPPGRVRGKTQPKVT